MGKAGGDVQMPKSGTTTPETPHSGVQTPELGRLSTEPGAQPPLTAAASRASCPQAGSLRVKHAVLRVATEGEVDTSMCQYEAHTMSRSAAAAYK